MLTILFIILSILSPSLYSMENNHNNWLLYKQLITTPNHDLPSRSNEPDTIKIFSTIIDVAEYFNNGHLMAKLIHICLPLEVIKTYINPHLAQCVAIKYNQKLLSYKYQKNLFKNNPFNYNTNQLITISNHDGTYRTAPQRECNYAMWKVNSISTRHSCSTKEKYSHQLLSNNNEKRLLYSLAEHNNKKLHFIFSVNSLTYIKLHFTYPPSRYLFSNDCTELALCFVTPKTLVNIKICKTASLNNNLIDCHDVTLDGTIKTLCTAHHSPIFVVGSNSFSAEDHKYNLVYITQKKHIFLKGHTSPVICTEFSSDDTILLTCSYNPITQTSQLRLWDISNNNNIICICDACYNEHIIKAFFMHKGQRIITINNKGAFHFLDGLTGYDIKKYNFSWNNYDTIDKSNAPLLLWSIINQFYMSIFEKNICIRKSTTGALLVPMISVAKTPIEVGLTDDENTIVFIDKNRHAYQLELYNQHDKKEINFIKEHANILQLYTLLTICKNNKGTEKTASFVETIKLYIQEQLKS